MPFFIYSNYDGNDSQIRESKVQEEWSDAARAAAAAARKYRGKGSETRSRAAMRAFKKAGGSISYGKSEFRSTKNALMRRGIGKSEAAKRARKSIKDRIGFQNYVDTLSKRTGIPSSRINRRISRGVNLTSRTGR